jgi:hypothetical protein
MTSLARRTAAKFMKWHFRKLGAPMLKDLITRSQDVRKAQQNVLSGIMRYAEPTAYGKAHGFSTIQSSSEFATRVPVNTYESLRPWVSRHEQGEPDVLFPGKPMFYATTSGTTDAPKRIPISQKYHDECYNGLSHLWLHSMFVENPGFMDGYDISMVGKAIEGHTADGTSYGSFSGHMNAYASDFVRRFRVIPFEVHDIDDYPARYYALLRTGLAYPIRWIVAANPSNLLEMHRAVMANLNDIIRDIHDGGLKPGLNINRDLRQKITGRLKPNRQRARELEKLVAQHGESLRPSHYWPTLQLINTWKSGNAAVYLRQTEGYYPPHTVIREFGYLATEARAGIVLHNADDISILAAHLLYFEFVERNEIDSEHPTFLGAHELETGREYAVFITTPSGLYRYNMNDILKVEDFFGTFPMVRFVQKGSGVTSLTGEKVYESQYLQAVEDALRKTGISAGFHMAFADLQHSVYRCFLEFQTGNHAMASQTETLAKEIDDALQRINPEYHAKRKSNRLGCMLLHPLPREAFDRYKTRKLKQGNREAQFKLTHLQQDDNQMNLLFSICSETTSLSDGEFQ